MALQQHLRKMWVAYMVLTLSLFPTAVVYYAVKANVQGRDRTRFERLVRDDTATIAESLPRFSAQMRGIRGLFAASSNVTALQWDRYVTEIVRNDAPGLRAIGYLEKVEPNQKDDFLAQLERDSNAPVQILPPGERPVYFPEKYVRSVTPGLSGAPGHDHFADSQRADAMAAARDSGDARITGKIDLDATSKLPGFAIYLPVYREGVTPATTAERETKLQGFIFAEFNSAKWARGLVGEGTSPLLGCAMYDGRDLSAAHLLYGDPEILNHAMDAAHRENETVTVPILNRTWTVYFASLPAFELESNHNLPYIALICWMTLGFLVFAITYGEIEALSRAEGIAGELRKSEIALAEEKERLSVTLYSIADGVITVDGTGNILSLNQAAEELTGWRHEEAQGQPLAAVYKTTSESQPDAEQMSLDMGKISSPAETVTLVTRDGAEKAISRSAATVHDRAGNTIGTVLVFRDITQKQRSEAELLKENKLESVGLLAGGIAHDFNNILQGIIGNLSLARMNAHAPEKMLERLTAVEKSAQRAKELTQQLVMFARGGAPIRRRAQIINLVKESALAVTQGGNVNCEFSLSAEIWPVEIDEGQFRQVVNNIVLNAVQAMPAGGKIEIKADNVELGDGALLPLKPGRYVNISVGDHGTGIAAQHLPRIFDPYFTTRPHSRGLGLASAYSVVRKHDGQITVETHVGKGSTFQIYIPAAAPAAAPVATEGESGQQQRLFAQGRILVMDDETVILDLSKAMLEMMGYEVQTATDGGEALRLYKEASQARTPFTLVITDLTVPEGMGGRELIRHLREFDPGVKAIVSSGYSLDPVMANYRDFGFSGVMPKPYMIEDLKRVLAEVIEKPV